MLEDLTFLSLRPHNRRAHKAGGKDPGGQTDQALQPAAGGQEQAHRRLRSPRALLLPFTQPVAQG